MDSERHKPLKKRRPMSIAVDERAEAGDADSDTPPAAKSRRVDSPPSTARGLAHLVHIRRRDISEQMNEEEDRDMVDQRPRTRSPSFEGEDEEKWEGEASRERQKRGHDEDDHALHSIPTKRARVSHTVASASQSDRSTDDRQQLQRANLDQPFQSSKAMQMMTRMGYKAGEGLGTRGEGRLAPIALSTQHERRGLGTVIDEQIARDYNAQWDDADEMKTVEERPLFIECSDAIREAFCQQLREVGDDWLGVEKETLTAMLNAKSVFDALPDRELREARARANPYESIGSAFFQNRAAMKTANLDRIYDWQLIQEDGKRVALKNPLADGVVGSADEVPVAGENVDRDRPLFYFADVCAGPGGFTEYMLWRKGFYNAKGFGFTLKGKDDFKLERFSASAPEFFEPFYVNKDDKNDRNDVTKPGNLRLLKEFVRGGTGGQGVDLFMADGGFSVEGKELIQEILSKRLYLCQFLAGLSLLRAETTAHTSPPDSRHQRVPRPGGNFFCKVFDIFTPFSAGLLYLLYIAFRRFSLHKPHTSRPANSERYVVCFDLTEQGAGLIADYLTRINDFLEEMALQKSEDDILHVVPLEMIKDDRVFTEYLVAHNESIARRQTQYLEKYRIFAKNQGQIDMDQGDLRDQCMQYWQVPNVQRARKQPNEKQLREQLQPGITFRAMCPQVLQEMDVFCRRAPAFSESILTTRSEPMQMPFAEYRLTMLTERDVPVLLIGLGVIAWVLFAISAALQKQSNWVFSPTLKQWMQCEYFLRLPRATVLLVQFTKRFTGAGTSGKATSERKIVRVLDAALLNGDDVSGLRYNWRMAAVKKFCDALNVERTMPQFAVIVPAETFRFENLDDRLKSRFAIAHLKGVEQAILRDNDEPDNYYICHGMRVISILKDPWMMAWSKGQKQCYVFNKQTRESKFEKDIEPAHDSAESFWNVLTSGKKRDGSSNPDKQWTWSWATTVSGTVYGPRTILEDERSDGGPTFRSLQQLVHRGGGGEGSGEERSRTAAEQRKQS